MAPWDPLQTGPREAHLFLSSGWVPTCQACAPQAKKLGWVFTLVQVLTMRAGRPPRAPPGTLAGFLSAPDSLIMEL